MIEVFEVQDGRMSFTSPELRRYSALTKQLTRSLIETTQHLEREASLLPERIIREQLIADARQAMEGDSIPAQRLREVLDEQIRLWRKRARMDCANSGYTAEAAEHYIDAYQYLREVFIGAGLPEDK